MFPIIFIGMHRSGTSLLGDSLEQLGLFVGHKKDQNNEAIFFLELNTWMMAQCGARWDQPEPVNDLWKDECRPVLDASQDYIQHLLKSPRATYFLGLRRYITNRSIERLNFPWGWKDPRNTYTLPFWLRLFPEARVVFIERHGVDVAESLRVRAQKTIKTTTKKYQKFRRVAWFSPKKGGFCDGPRCLLLEGGFSLWEEYQKQAKLQVAVLPEENVLRLRYEELLANPQPNLEALASFCGLQVAFPQIQMLGDSINPERAYSYRASPHLIAFAESRKQRLEVYGYGV